MHTERERERERDGRTDGQIYVQSPLSGSCSYVLLSVVSGMYGDHGDKCLVGFHFSDQAPYIFSLPCAEFDYSIATAQ